MQTHNVKWKISLSNGETLHEGKGNYKEVKGEVSPTQRLYKYIEENNLTITSLSLYTDSGYTYNLHSLGTNPQFHIFNRGEKPIEYKVFRQLGTNVGNKSDLYTVAQATYKHFSLQLWVDENNPKNCWSLAI